MVFDRADLRVMRLAYDESIAMLTGRRSLDVPQRSRLAKLVVEAAWARNCRGLSLRGAGVLIAKDATARLDETVPLALCA